MSNENRQHWIARVQDSINDYREVQSAYFDGTESDAELYFTNRCPVIGRYSETEGSRARYQIIMAANPVVLQ